MPCVRILNGPSKNTVVDIGEDSITIGRDPSCTLQILDKGASRIHADIFRIGELYFIRDCGSRNGTYLNEQKLDEELLREGDVILIGATRIVFEGGEQSMRRQTGIEFSQEEPPLAGALELKLEDLTTMNISGDTDAAITRRLRALYQIGRILADERDERAMADKALTYCAETFSADKAYLFTYDNIKGSILPVGTFSRGEDKGSKVSRGIIRRAISEKRTILTTDAMRDDRFSARKSIMLKGIRSVICAPLSATGALSGVLYMASDSTDRSFDEEDLELVTAMADQVGMALRGMRMRQELRETLMSTIRVLIGASERATGRPRGHAEEVAASAKAIAGSMHLPPAAVEDVQLAGLLHNVGSLLGDDEDLVRQARALLPEGREATPEQLQPLLGYLVIRTMRCSEAVREGVRCHHELLDGSGYPAGLKGREVPLIAQVVGLANEFVRRRDYLEPEGSGESDIKDMIVELGGLGGKRYADEVVKGLLVAYRHGELTGPGADEVEFVADPEEADGEGETPPAP